MADQTLSREALQKIDKLVERVARKAGYTGNGELTYKEHLQMKLEQNRDKLTKGYNKYKHKLSLKPSQKDLSEEIKTYLRDGLADLMKEGYTEKEALQITMDKFDEAELRKDFGEFMEAFDGFGIEAATEQWYMQHGEVIGLFYAGFLFLGLTIGGF
ncbi:hypothetical protein, partial [Gorillibacterium massiliense]|uniref:hypothetical protein n=1 Tax=Gorillibacterium massiliense TaxID=1280390 RepID=UPI000593C371